MSKNIEMNYFNGSGYDQLYPRSKMSNISDWNSYVYSKGQVDSSINSINGRIDTVTDRLDNLDDFVEKNNYNLVKSTTINETLHCGYGYPKESFSQNYFLAQKNSFYYYQDILIVANGSINWSRTTTTKNYWNYVYLLNNEDDILDNSYTLINLYNYSSSTLNWSRKYSNEIWVRDFFFSNKLNSVQADGVSEKFIVVPTLTDNFYKGGWSNSGSNNGPIVFNFTINGKVSESYNPGETSSLNANLTINFYTRNNPWITSI